MTHDPDTAQHMEALGEANRIRFARAELKREVLRGDTTVLQVLSSPPEFTDHMPLGELLRAQDRWGHTRVRKFLNQHNLSVTKPIGSLTLRQRRELLETDQLKNASDRSSRGRTKGSPDAPLAGDHP